MNSFKAACQSIRRSPYQALVAFLVTFIALFLVFCFSTAIMAGQTILNYYETQPQLIAFFKQDVSNETALEILDKLGKQADFGSKVKDYKFVSKEDAVTFAKESNKNDPLLLELITPELLPASVEISTYNPSDLAVIKDALAEVAQIDEISFHEDVVETFLHWTNVIRNVGLIVCAVLLFLTFLVMNVVIGMKVVDHRQSIKIMQIIGATKFYIRRPYLIEAMIYGVVSCLFAWLALIGILYFAGDQIQNFFNPIQVFPLAGQYQWWQLGLGLGISLLICFFAAWRAVSRIVKRKP